MSYLYNEDEFEEFLKIEVGKHRHSDIKRKLIDMPEGDEVELNEEDFFSLLHIAVDNNDREYFEELVERSNKL